MITSVFMIVMLGPGGGGQTGRVPDGTEDGDGWSAMAHAPSRPASLVEVEYSADWDAQLVPNPSVTKDDPDPALADVAHAHVLEDLDGAARAVQMKVNGRPGGNEVGGNDRTLTSLHRGCSIEVVDGG